jgi:hypothetical protein
MGEVATRIEAALQRHPQHTGLNHYLIHAVDALPVAARAAAAADRLGALAPKSPHLLHMPAHTYVNLGRYADASRVNEQALAADASLAQELAAQGFSVSKDWRAHNSHFLWYAALMQGRGDLALETARGSATRAANADHEFGEIARSRPLMTLVRLERWEAVLAEPQPGGDKGPAKVLGLYARGTALARTGEAAQAAARLAELEPAAAALIAAHAGSSYPDKLLRGIGEMARASLRAEVAMAEGRADAALAAQAQAVGLSKDLDENEPPVLGAPARLALGDLQLKARRFAEAEATFRDDLARHPRSGWALRGLARAVQAQGREAEAGALKRDAEREWPAADRALLALN